MPVTMAAQAIMTGIAPWSPTIVAITTALPTRQATNARASIAGQSL